MATKRKRVTKKAAAPAKKEVCCEHKHCNCFGWGLVILILGILFVAKDYGMLTWFKFSWWSIVFVLMGLHHVFKK
ncbi:hypothetical protein HOK51_06930 [Candidatus Woesearchaeota archaeon]|jgi:hypothetical protein|nr:hypothetical protein [Candidatus Woesearchaeota archaeon]MBT6519557.1 hypothetical protein [Candidatus Woesearchaeota archaeon]MBT7367698.1 hypothetical protein [Candidatus Woesearchaeota archaeon]